MNFSLDDVEITNVIGVYGTVIVAQIQPGYGFNLHLERTYEFGNYVFTFENDYYETQTFSSTIKITDTLNGAFWIKVENSDSGKGIFNPSYPLYIQSITVVYTAQ